MISVYILKVFFIYFTEINDVMFWKWLNSHKFKRNVNFIINIVV